MCPLDPNHPLYFAYRSENILALELDMPERLTCDITPGSGPDPRAQAAIDQAFWDDGHILLLAPPSGIQQQLHLVGQDISSYTMHQRTGSPMGGHPHRPGSARRQAGSAVQLR